MQTTTARLSRVAPELPATDLHASIAFYVQQLGFEVAAQMEGYAIVERDGIALHLFDDAGRKYSRAGIHVFTKSGEMELFRPPFASEGQEPAATAGKDACGTNSCCV